MVPFFLSVASRLPIAVGVLSVWFAVERWLWFRTLPRHAAARFCGNCFLAAVGVPTELGLLGLLVVAVSVLKIPYCIKNVTYWCSVVLGVLLTPQVIGVPLFAFGFVVLMTPIITGLFKGTGKVPSRS